MEVEQRKLPATGFAYQAVEQEGVQFLAYINPYVASDKDLWKRRQSAVIWQKMSPVATIW